MIASLHPRTVCLLMTAATCCAVPMVHVHLTLCVLGKPCPDHHSDPSCCPLFCVDYVMRPLQMRRQSGLPVLTRAEALAPLGASEGGTSRLSASAPNPLSSAHPTAPPNPAVAPAAQPSPPPNANVAAPASPPALQRESMDSGSSAAEPPPAKRPRHGAQRSPPHTTDSAALTLPTKQVLDCPALGVDSSTCP